MIKCGIVQDILPLYTDGVCSEESKVLVEEHIKTCEKCGIELENMQGEVGAGLQYEEKNINILKSIRKKFFKKNVFVALVSVAVSITILVSVGCYVFLYEKIIPYEEGLIKAEVHFDTVEKEALDMSLSKNNFGMYMRGRYIEENGQTIYLVYINFTETVVTKLDKSYSLDKFTRIIEPQIDDEQADFCEVYYLGSPIYKLSEKGTQEEYAEVRTKGALVWRGKLKR